MHQETLTMLLTTMQQMDAQRQQQAEEREIQRQKEAEEREARRQKEADAREERLLMLIQNMKVEATQAVTLQTQISEKQLALNQEAHDRALAKDKQDREWMVQKMKEEKADKERQQLIKHIPKPQPMAANEDVEEFLEAFERNMTSREIPRQMWADNLTPLLNSNCKAAIASLPLDEKTNYNTIHDLILHTCTRAFRDPGLKFMEATIKAGESFRATTIRLNKLAYKYAPEEDSSKVRDKMSLEVFLRNLPKRVSNYVREKKPNTALEAADIAGEYVSREGWDEFAYSTDNNKGHHKEGEPYGFRSGRFHQEL